MADFLVITGPGAALGFRCAGISSREIDEKEDIGSLLSSLQIEGKYGLIAVEESILNKVPDSLMRRMSRKGLPIIVPITIPRRWEEGGVSESPVVKLIRKAIGYQIKLKR